MSATLRAKMVVGTVQQQIGNDGKPFQENIALSPVHSDDPNSANKQWSKWTPSGSLTLVINNPAAFGRVKPGEYYFIDMIPTDKDSI